MSFKHGIATIAADTGAQLSANHARLVRLLNVQD